MHKLELQWREKQYVYTYPIHSEQPTTIGRFNCDIVLAQQTISRQHASIFAQGGVFYIHNLSKVNGITINDTVHLSHGQMAPLQVGDVFQLGPIQIQVVLAQETHVETLQIECSSCGKLNEYNPQQQCKFCGVNLASGHTIVQ